MCSPLVPRKGNQEYGTAGARLVLQHQAAGLAGLVETAAQLCLQESGSLHRARSQGGVQKGSALCAETFGAEVCRPARRRFCNSRSAQGQTNWGVSRPSPGRRAVSLQITSSYSPGQGQAAYRTRPVQPQRGNGQTSNDLRGSSHAQVGRQATRLHAKSGCRECVLSRTHSSQAPQVLLQPLSAAALCQQQIHRTAARRLFRLLQTRPRAIGAFGSNAFAPAPPLSSSRRVFTCGLAARLDQLAQNLDKCHVSSRRSPSPPRYAHTALCRRPLDRLQLLRGSFAGAPNHRGDASRRGHRPCATQGLLRHTFADPARSSGLQYLHRWQRSPTGSREEVLCAPPSSARAAFRGVQESAPGRLRPPSALRRRSHFVLACSSLGSLSPPRGVQLPRAVQAALLPLTRGSRQPSLLAQLLRQEPREPSRALARPAIHGALHRRIGHHGLGLSAGAASRGHEIECRLVGVARSVGDDSSKGAQGCSPRPASESRRHTWPHGQTLPRQHGSCRRPSQNVF